MNGRWSGSLYLYHRIYVFPRAYITAKLTADSEHGAIIVGGFTPFHKRALSLYMINLKRGEMVTTIVEVH